MGSLRLLPLIFLLAFKPAHGTATLCDYYGSDGTRSYALELIGYDSIAMIQANSHRELRIGELEVMDFDYRERRVHVMHHSSGAVDAFPSFVLKGTGSNVSLHIDGVVAKGELTCQWQLDG